MLDPIVAGFTLTITLSSLASVMIPLSPTMLNLIPPFLFNCCVAVTVALSPPKLIVLDASLYNWEPFIASFDVGVISPSATSVIFLSPALIPSFVIEIFLAPGVDGVIVNPSPFTTVLFPLVGLTNSADVKSFNCLFKLYVYLWFPFASTFCSTARLSPAT